MHFATFSTSRRPPSRKYAYVLKTFRGSSGQSDDKQSRSAPGHGQPAESRSPRCIVAMALLHLITRYDFDMPGKAVPRGEKMG